MASRRKGRILAFQSLYSWEASGGEKNAGIPEDLLNFSWLGEKRDELDQGTVEFSRLLIAGTIENRKEVDAMIQRHLNNWDISRLNRVDLAVLRMSAYALMYQDDIPPSIVIDEAIGISKEYGADDSFRFVNGVLDGIRKTLQSERSSVSQP
ncbi:MAG: transcription antitermination factor NusB [Spirochaetaceae bacterium]|jgi:N utilization substance protein B|nr:transcription antitermination factor NusB [Spirochaetaceae bacterium]